MIAPANGTCRVSVQQVRITSVIWGNFRKKTTLMTGIVHFETFLLAGILLNLTQGNDTIFILTKSIGQGIKAGIISTLGITTGSVGHTILAAFGLSIIIAKSILLFNIIKYPGAAYLLYMGYKMLTNRTQLKTDGIIHIIR